MSSRVEEARQEDAAQHPLIGRVGRGAFRVLDRVRRRRRRAGKLRRVHRDVLLGVARHLDAVETPGPGVRDLHAADRLPVAQHGVEGGVARDVVVVLGADGRRQLGLAVEQHRELVLADLQPDRRIGLAVELLVRHRRDVGRMLQRIEHQRRRIADHLAGLRGEPDAGHRLAALGVGHVAHLGRHRFAVLQLFGRRIFLVAVPVDADRVGGKLARHGIGRVAEEARLAAGLVRLSRLPELGVALDRDGLERLERLGAALRGHRLLHQILCRLRGCRPCQHRAEHQRNAGRNDSQHDLLPACDANAVGLRCPSW